MKNFNKKKESTVIEADGVTPDKFVVQFNDKAPHIRLYERKKRGDIIINSKVGQFYKFNKAKQRAWSLSKQENTNG